MTELVDRLTKALADRYTIERELGIKTGKTTEDIKYTLETVNCVGACALGPIVVVDGEHMGKMNTEKVKPLLSSYD